MTARMRFMAFVIVGCVVTSALAGRQFSEQHVLFALRHVT